MTCRFRLLLKAAIVFTLEIDGQAFTYLWSPAPRIQRPMACALNLADELDPKKSGKKKNDRVGGYDPYEKIGVESIDVGDPQTKVKEKDMSVTSILKELAAIQQQGPRKYCILGTRHCSYLHQQIIELL